ncbi:MAG: hypothetical protein IKO93_15565, partial [Lentisphaeria bacterium]|nr:hypothetical protein [Lentisphaeria bacterium]
MAAGEILPPFCVSGGKNEHFSPKKGEKTAILPKILHSRLDSVSPKSYIKWRKSGNIAKNSPFTGGMMNIERPIYLQNLKDRMH